MSCFGVLPAATPGLPESESHSLAPGPAHSGGDLRREGPAPRSAGEGLRTHRACRCSGRGWARRSPPLRQLCRALARGHTHTSALLVALRVLWSEKSVGRVRGCEAARLGRGGGGHHPDLAEGRRGDGHPDRLHKWIFVWAEGFTEREVEPVARRASSSKAPGMVLTLPSLRQARRDSNR